MSSKSQQPKCYICSSSDDNIVDYGELLPKTRSDSFVVHYFCVLLSSEIPQNGADNEDVYGFLIKDIKKILQKFSKTKCRYCRNRRAASKCRENACHIRFHACCAIKQKCLPQFIEPDNLSIYCHIHSPQAHDKIRKRTQDKVRADIQTQINRNTLTQSEKDEKLKQLMSQISDRHFEVGNVCSICGESFTEDDLGNVITPPCCWSHNGLNPNYHVYGLHWNCVKFQAYYAGYKFKCPFCSDSDYFLSWVNEIGIFVPKRYALWEDSELENRSLLGVPATCSAATCHCQDGRDYCAEEEDNEYHILICYTCGSNAIHQKCLDAPTEDPTYQYKCYMCHISIIEQTALHQDHERNIPHDDSMDIEIDDVPTIDVHGTDSEPEWTPEQLFEEMDEVKPIIKIPKPIPLVSRAYVVQQRNHFRFQIRNWVREQKESGNWNC